MRTRRRTALLLSALLLSACADGPVDDGTEVPANNQQPPLVNNDNNAPVPANNTNNPFPGNNTTPTNNNNTTPPNNTNNTNNATPTNNSNNTNNTNNPTPTNNTNTPAPVPVPDLIPAYPHAEGSVLAPRVDGLSVDAPAAGSQCVEWNSTDELRTTTTFGPHGPTEVVYYLGDVVDRTETLTYDSAGNLISRLEVNQAGIELSDESWTYDAAGHAIAYARTTREDDGSTRTSGWQRTIAGGMPVQETWFDGSGGAGTTYFTYADGGRIREEYQEDPSTGADWVARYTYDDMGRQLTEALSGAAFGGSAAQPVIARRTYDVGGRLVEISQDGNPNIFKRFTWADGLPVKVEAGTIGHDIEVTASWTSYSGALRSKEATVDDQLFPTTWSYEGEGCRTSPADLSHDVNALHLSTF